MIVLLPITLVVVGRWRKRSAEAETRRWVEQASRSTDMPSWVKPSAPQSAPDAAVSSNAAASPEAPQQRKGFFRRVGHGFAHSLDDRRPSGYSSIAPRRPDGSRTKVFFFNGNGRSR